MSSKVWGWITLICGAWWITDFILMMTGAYTNFETTAKTTTITLGIIMILEAIGFFLDDAQRKDKKE